MVPGCTLSGFNRAKVLNKTDIDNIDSVREREILRPEKLKGILSPQE